MRRIALFLLLLGFLTTLEIYAQTSTNPAPGQITTEEDGSPELRCLAYKFSNGNVTDNGDGTCSIADSDSGASPWTDSGSEVYLPTVENVGIGTHTVGALLVVGSGGTLDNVSDNDVYIKNDLEVDGSIYGDGSQLTGISGSEWSASGTDVILATITDNVGIGSAVPDTKLDVDGTITATGFIVDTSGDPRTEYKIGSTVTFVTGIDDSDADKFKVGTSALETNTRMTITSAGNVGIGSIDPLALLDIAGNIAVNGVVGSDDQVLKMNGATLGWEADAGAAGSSEWTDDGAVIYPTEWASENVGIGTNLASSKLTVNGQLEIENAGNVGIGTDQPLASLHVGAGSGATSVGANDVYIVNDLEIDGTVYMAACSGAGCGGGGDNITEGDTAVEVIDTGSDGNITFDIDGTEIMYLTNEGNLGIGSTLATATLHVVSSAAANNFALKIQNTASSGEFLAFINRLGAEVVKLNQTTAGDGILILNDSGGTEVFQFDSENGGLELDPGAGFGYLQVDGNSGGCIMLRDTDNAGWTQCDALDGTLTCAADGGDGVCD